jgi:hypothetical protein
MGNIQKLEQQVKDLYEKKSRERDAWSDWLYENHCTKVGPYDSSKIPQSFSQLSSKKIRLSGIFIRSKPA